MRIVLIGSVESTKVTFDALSQCGMQPDAVFGLDPELSGRHSDFVDMGSVAAQAKVPFFGVRSINSEDVVSRLRALRPDWLVVVGWSQLCGEALLATPRIGSIGYHPSALPEMRGRAVLAWTILLDRRATAGTLFRLAPSVDSGEILAQHSFDVAARETLPSLLSKHMSVLRDMWLELAPRLVQGNVEGRPQDESRASYCAKRTAADGVVQWHSTADHVDRLVRAVANPYPGAFGWLRGRKLTIWKAKVWEGSRYFGLPGQLLARPEQGLLIACGDNTALLAQEWEWDGGAEQRLPIGEHILSNSPIKGEV